MLWILAWKNIWRNKLRSIVVMVGVTLGVLAGVFMIAFMNGMVKDRIHSIIRSEISHIQIHQPGFEENHDFSLRMKEVDSMTNKINEMNHIEAASKRIMVSSMVASAQTSLGVNIIGVVPEQEKKVTNIHQKLVEGSYFGDEGKNRVVIGKKLAEKLKVKLKNKIIITLQDTQKSIVAGAFRVVGIYETDNSLFDEANLFIRYEDICRLTGIEESEAHEVAILLDQNEDTKLAKLQLQQTFSKLKVQDWMELSPEAGYLVSAMNQYMYIFILIILVALCFSIINTMLMVVLERVRELGMLMAIGMNKVNVFFMILLETVYLSLTGGIIGIATGYLICKHFETAGLDLYFWKEAYSSVGYASVIYPVIDFEMLAITTLMVVFTGILSALYPAYKALSLNPAESIRS